MSAPMDDESFDSDIAVVGMAGRFAGARNLAEYWRNLRDGVESLTRFSEAELLAAGVDPGDLADPNYVPVGAVLPDMEQFDARFFGFSPREASIMDPQHRHFLECAWEALENAGHVPDQFAGSIGVFGGSGHNAYMPYNLMSNPQLMASVGFFLVRHTGNDKDFLTTRVSYLLNLKGPSVNVATACSTSLVAIHMGVQSLLSRECDMVLAGGVTIEMPHRHGYVYRESEILSPDGHCHAFDADSKGTVFGSGVGIVVLRRLADAVADGDHIHAVIKGSAVNNDGALKVGYMAPSVDGQAQAIAEALAVANVGPETITYVEAHGTGTPVGDPIEIAALTQAYRQGTDAKGYCGIGSVKSNIGHTDTAAGVASFIKVALAMQHRELPPSLHFTSPNPACEFERSPFYVNSRLSAWQPPRGVPRRAGVSSLGVGGTNAHIILEEAPRRGRSGPSRPYQLLVQSAKTITALDAASTALADHLAARPELPLADVAHTLQVGRQAMKHRRIVVARDPADAAEALRAGDARRVFTEVLRDGATRSAVFMFAGGGAQHPNMGLGLYRSEPVFRDAVDECLGLLSTRLNLDLRSTLFPAEGTEAAAAAALAQPSLALPALLSIQYAQARLLMAWGVTPTAAIGHSMGEYTAALLAGVFTLADALTLVQLRGRLFETLPEGGMLSVPLSESELQPLLGQALSISVINGPKMTVVGGPVAAIETLQQQLAGMDVEAARVRINVAAHSSMLEPILEEFATFLKRVPMKAPELPFISNLSGTWITPAEATDPQYWVRHLRHTVRFADGLKELLADESRILLEVGPGRTLTSLARQHPARAASQAVFNAMRHPDEAVDDQAMALTVLGRLWLHGLPIDWARLRGDEQRLRLPLPGYQFDHERHWVEPGKGHSATIAAADRPLYKRKDLAQWFYRPVWRQSVVPTLPAQPADDEVLRARTLVLADATGFGLRLAERLRAEGSEVVVVMAGPAYRREGNHRFTLNPRQPADYERLMATLNGEGRPPQRIVHLWTLTGKSGATGTLAEAGEMQALGFYSLLNLVQAVGREDLSDPIRLAVISDHMQRVAGETGLVPAKATVLGPVKVIPREFPQVRCQSVDIDTPIAGSRIEALLLDALAAELATDLQDDIVAYRAAQRWVQEYEAAPLPPVVGVHQRLRQNGTYLLTGGLGGVGLALADHLARTLKAKLVLVGRHGLPPRAEWPQCLADATGDPQRARRIQQVMALEALGAEVMVAAADVTDLPQMKAVLKQARARFGPVQGLLHTAGVLNDGVIQLKEASIAASVLAPKLMGTLVLANAIQEVQGDAPPDFCVLFSSISAFAGLAGQIDYAAANAFLDAFAQERFTRDSSYTVAVNWSQWQEVGMAAELAHQLGVDTETSAFATGTELGLPLIDRRLLDSAGEQVYATRVGIDRHWLLSEHRVRGGEALIPGTGYLEIVRAAFAHAQAPQAEQAAIELSDVTFLAPFAVRAGEQRELRIHLRTEAQACQFSVVSPAPGASANSKAGGVENVRGRVRSIEPDRPASDSIDSIRARCTARTLLARDLVQRTHLDFGPRWNNIERIDFGQGEAVISLQLPAAYAADLGSFPLHPALMDMATGAAQALVPDYDEARDFFVPAAYQRLRMFAPLGQSITSHVRYRADETGSDDLAVYDVRIFDAGGQVLVDIEGFTMIRVRDKALLAPTGPASAPQATAAARPKATANNVLALGLHDGILSAEGAEALQRVLAWGAGPQMAVSPQDLKGLLARFRLPAEPRPRGDAAAGVEGGENAPGWRAPSTKTEILIAQMWAEMLGHAKVGAGDDFFDLGGHSLLAVQVINKLKKRTGVALPLTALLEAPTVEALAALIEPPGTAADTSAGDAGSPRPESKPAARVAGLIQIRPGVADKLPIFFVHDGLGETLLYRSLALQLNPGHAVFGIQPDVNPDGTYAQTRIVDWAAAHISKLRSVQPHGPYLLAGLCAGGVIAFEMSRQLQDAGERTLFLGILDAADVHAAERPFRTMKERLQRVQGTFDSPAGTSWLGRLGQALPRISAKAWGFVRYQLERQIDQKRAGRTVERLRGMADDPAGSETSSVPQITYLQLYELAHKEHRPSGRLAAGEVVLFKAIKGDGSVADTAYADVYSDAHLGWSPRVDGTIVAIDVPGGHSSMLQPPNVQTLAEHMRRQIGGALARQARSAEPDTAAVAAEKDRSLGLA